MSFMTKLFTNFLPPAQQTLRQLLVPSFAVKPLTEAGASNASPGGLFSVSVRNNIRCHFPRPSERKRIKRHGFWKRMSTKDGQKILMRRILKGRHVLSH